MEPNEIIPECFDKVSHEEFLKALLQELPPTQTTSPFSIEEIKASFTDASIRWKENKRKKGAGYIYQCQHRHKNGNLCKRDVFWKCGNVDFHCKYHFYDYKKKERKEPVVTIDDEYLNK